MLLCGFVSGNPQILTPNEGARLFTSDIARAQHSSNGSLRTLSRQPISVKPELSHFARMRREAEQMALYYPGSDGDPMQELRTAGRAELALPTSLQEEATVFLQDESRDDIGRPTRIVADEIKLLDLGRRKSRQQFKKLLARSLSSFTLSRAFQNRTQDDPKLMEDITRALKTMLKNLREGLIRRQLITGDQLLGFTRADAAEYFKDSILDNRNSVRIARLVASSLDGGDDYYSLGQYEPAYQDAMTFVRELSSLIQFAIKSSEAYDGAEKDAYLKHNVLPFIGFLQQVGFYLGPRQGKAIRERIYALLDMVPSHKLPVSNEMKNHMLRMLVPANAASSKAKKFRKSRPSLENMGLDRHSIKESKKQLVEDFAQSVIQMPVLN